MEKLNLNFFGEEVNIDYPKDLQSLKIKISEKFLLSDSDVAEIILYYVEDSKKIYIINGNDFLKFKESKINYIFLDVNQNSKLYLDNIKKLTNDKNKEKLVEKEENKEEKKEEIKEEKKEEKKDERKEEKKDEKKDVIDIQNEKRELRKLNVEMEKVDKKIKETAKKYDIKISELIKQIVELENIKSDLELERAMDMEELYDERKKIFEKIDTIKKRIEPPKKEEEDVVLKAAPSDSNKGKYFIRSGQNNFPYSKEAMRKNYENKRKFEEKLKAAKEKRMKERKELELKIEEMKKQDEIKEILPNIPSSVPVFTKVEKILEKAIEKVKEVAKEQVKIKNEEFDKKVEEVKQEKEKIKKEKIEKIQKITKEAVKDINDLTKLIIDQSNSFIEIINNPELFRSSSSDDILLKAAPKKEKKTKPEIHFHVLCDGCKMNPLRGNRYKCKTCKDFDFCEECYLKNKESHGHEFYKIAHPRCRNRLGHPNTKYCQRGLVHSKVMCDGCGMLPLTGWRYKCSICDDYNLCENCEESIGGKHFHFHPFLKIVTPMYLEKFNENYLKLNTYEPKKDK